MDDVLLNKAGIIERCLKRVDEEYRGHEDALETDFTRQDSIVLNLQRACEASIDAAMHLVRIHRLGIPQQSRDAFGMLVDASLIDAELCERLKAMVGFRNIAVHDYRKLNIAIVRAIIDRNFDDFTAFSRMLIVRAGENDEQT